MQKRKINLKCLWQKKNNNIKNKTALFRFKISASTSLFNIITFTIVNKVPKNRLLSLIKNVRRGEWGKTEQLKSADVNICSNNLGHKPMGWAAAVVERMIHHQTNNKSHMIQLEKYGGRWTKNVGILSSFHWCHICRVIWRFVLRHQSNAINNEICSSGVLRDNTDIEF